MQDRFKFRIWDKKRQVIRDVWSVTPFGVVVNDVKTESYRVPLDDCVIMQCTGLKDKNGKLIFEGDILEICEIFKGFLYRMKVEIIYDTIKGFIYQGSYITKGHTVRFIKRHLSNLYDDEIDCLDGFICENIYENPELLEQ